MTPATKRGAPDAYAQRDIFRVSVWVRPLSTSGGNLEQVFVCDVREGKAVLCNVVQCSVRYCTVMQCNNNLYVHYKMSMQISNQRVC